MKAYHKLSMLLLCELRQLHGMHAVPAQPHLIPAGELIHKYHRRQLLQEVRRKSSRGCEKLDSGAPLCSAQSMPHATRPDIRASMQSQCCFADFLQACTPHLSDAEAQLRSVCTG